MRGRKACALAGVLAALACVSIDGAASSMKSAVRGMQREVGEDNKGYQMLRKMGWSSGAIGQSGDGLVEPIDPLANTNAHTSFRKSGIGARDGEYGDSPRGPGGPYRHDAGFVSPKTKRLTKREKRELREHGAQRQRTIQTTAHSRREKGAHRHRESSGGGDSRMRYEKFSQTRGLRGRRSGGAGVGGPGATRTVLAAAVHCINELPDQVLEAVFLDLTARAKRLSIPSSVLKLIWDMCASPRASSVWLPSTLSPLVRRQVHLLAADMGLTHRSTGHRRNRRMCVSMDITAGAEDDALGQGGLYIADGRGGRVDARGRGRERVGDSEDEQESEGEVSSFGMEDTDAEDYDENDDKTTSSEMLKDDLHEIRSQVEEEVSGAHSAMYDEDDRAEQPSALMDDQRFHGDGESSEARGDMGSVAAESSSFSPPIKDGRALSEMSVRAHSESAQISTHFSALSDAADSNGGSDVGGVGLSGAGSVGANGGLTTAEVNKGRNAGARLRRKLSRIHLQEQWLAKQSVEQERRAVDEEGMIKQDAVLQGTYSSERQVLPVSQRDSPSTSCQLAEVSICTGGQSLAGANLAGDVVDCSGIASAGVVTDNATMGVVIMDVDAHDGEAGRDECVGQGGVLPSVVTWNTAARPKPVAISPEESAAQCPEIAEFDPMAAWRERERVRKLQESERRDHLRRQRAALALRASEAEREGAAERASEAWQRLTTLGRSNRREVAREKWQVQQDDLLATADALAYPITPSQNAGTADDDATDTMVMNQDENEGKAFMEAIQRTGDEMRGIEAGLGANSLGEPFPADFDSGPVPQEWVKGWAQPGGAPARLQDTPLGASNIGFEMLRKMGWAGGGVGAQQQGRADPVCVDQRNSRLGLGAVHPPERSGRGKGRGANKGKGMGKIRDKGGSLKTGQNGGSGQEELSEEFSERRIEKGMQHQGGVPDRHIARSPGKLDAKRHVQVGEEARMRKRKLSPTSRNFADLKARLKLRDAGMTGSNGVPVAPSDVTDSGDDDASDRGAWKHDNGWNHRTVLEDSSSGSHMPWDSDQWDFGGKRQGRSRADRCVCVCVCVCV